MAEVLRVNGRKFPSEQLVVTRGVNDHIADDLSFAAFVLASLKRHFNGDWGEMDADDKAENDEALRNGEERLFSAYETETQPKIWIITEADRSATTVLFPDEY